MRWSLRPLRSLRVRVPVTAIAVFAVSLAVATLLAYQLFLQAGRADVDAILDRERDRFATAMQELLDEQATGDGTVDLLQLDQAVERYLALNPANQSYWTIIRLDGLPDPLASAQGPDLLEPLYPDRLPAGEPNTRQTLSTEAGDIRSSSAPIILAGDQVGTYQIIAPLEPIRQEAVQAAGLVAAAAGVSLLLGALLLTVTLWRSLSPLRGLATTARSTELRALDARVEEPATDDEVGLLAREFNLMLDRLERASESQTEFMASVSHELRTPITIARGHLELLRSIDLHGRGGTHDPDALAETIAVLEDELARMGRLVEDLLAIARADMDGFARPRDVELVAFFEDLELKVAGLRLPHVRIDPPPPVELSVDPDRLAQAVLNLVVNAHLHTPDGTRVAVRAAEAPGEVVLVVSDDGPGIPASIRDEVFAPFVRAGDAPSSTGLGLAVVRAVVDAHGGRVELDTGPEGTTFTLHLPVARASSGEVPAPEATADTAAAPVSPTIS
ncbi:HAMP domain-containing histidine kinase [Nitriliruptoraceae bacterium ZYF776]|nr:HAMP domain-containing histidine kinase [Profundirhabdus halotolerans]